MPPLLAGVVGLRYDFDFDFDFDFGKTVILVKRGGGAHRRAYASWHMPHAGPCSDFCADWCHDFPVLSSLTPLLDPSTSIRLGPRPRGEGSTAFPIVCELSDRLTD